jgi:hypothetical protein
VLPKLAVRPEDIADLNRVLAAFQAFETDLAGLAVTVGPADPASEVEDPLHLRLAAGARSVTLSLPRRLADCLCVGRPEGMTRAFFLDMVLDPALSALGGRLGATVLLGQVEEGVEGPLVRKLALGWPGGRGVAQIGFGAFGIPLLAACVGAARPSPGRGVRIPVPAEIELACWQFDPARLAAIAVGDVVLPRRGTFLPDRGTLVSGGRRLALVEIAGAIAAVTGPAPPACAGPQEGHLRLVLPTPGTGSDTLSALAPGSTLATAAPGGPIAIEVAGVRVGEGLVIDIDGHAALRVSGVSAPRKAKGRRSVPRQTRPASAEGPRGRTPAAPRP